MSLQLPPDRELPGADRMIEEILADEPVQTARTSGGRTVRNALIGVAAASALVLGGVSVGRYLTSPPQPAATAGPIVTSSVPSPATPSPPTPSPPGPSARPSTTGSSPAVDTARLPLGTTASSANFRVTVRRVVANSAQGVLVQAEVCVRKLPPNPTGKTTRVSWDPWHIATGERSYAPRLADSSHPPANLFPEETFLEVSECASGWIPFADAAERTDVRRVVYANSLGDTAAWLVN